MTRRPCCVALLFLASLASSLVPGGAMAETPRSRVVFNTASMQPTGETPDGGAMLTYPVRYAGGALDGCAAQIAETLFDHLETEGWGIFRVAVTVDCGDGSGFRYASAGAIDGNGFHGSGVVEEGSGTGRFAGLAGRVAQVGGSLVPGAEAGTFDVSYDLLLDRNE